ncbi:OmpA family protein [Salegentibacter chungangensis]|uniref:OmpA family protein n=1 Tax=Salegentibacter chungangensis TaxID=1335724 RepID=A0ABW3NSC5_9FLAO
MAQSQMKVIPEGSYLINMGLSPQTHSNALKPYGLLYDLLNNYQVEVEWVIRPGKKKDETDFAHDDTAYRSGSFVIPVSYISDEVAQRIREWEKKGVAGSYSKSSMNLPVFTSLSVAPKWTLDKENGSIALPFFQAAEIPSSAYGGSSSEGWKDPSELGVCDDIFVMPHADPKFETHKNLYFWNRDYKGAIWAGCRAVSTLENIKGRDADENKGSGKLIQLNFLSAGFAGAPSAGLVPYYDHRNATPPYTHLFPHDPVAQYLGSTDKAHLNGSERVYFPKAINLWREETKRLVIDPDAPDIPSKSKGEAAMIVYGHAFGNPRNGMVMYEGGHSIYGSGPEYIAAMRAFFNWSFYTTEIKRKENLIKFQAYGKDKTIVAARVGDDLTRVLNLDPIHFDLDKAQIRENDKEGLEAIVQFMKEHPALLLDIRSHTDSRAADAYNLELSRERVKATIAYFTAQGIDAERLSGRGYGETELLNDCSNGKPCSERKHELNRRSEFILSIDCRLYAELGENARLSAE